MRTCRTCDYWKPPSVEPYSNDPINVGLCLCPKIVFGWADYGSDEVIMLDKRDGSLLALDAASVQDGSGYAASFHPGPLFGCIHHKEKADGPTDV